MKHTIEYNGERKTVDAKRTATIGEVLAIAFPSVWTFDYTKVKCLGSGKYAEGKAK